MSFLATKFHEIAISQNVCYVLQKLIIFLNTKNCEIAQLRVFYGFSGAFTKLQIRDAFTVSLYYRGFCDSI